MELNCFRWGRIRRTPRMFYLTLLLFILASSINGTEEDLPISPSNHPKSRSTVPTITIETSDSIRDTKTTTDTSNSLPLSSSVTEEISSVQKHTPSVIATEITPKKRRHLDDNNISDENDSTRQPAGRAGKSEIYNEEYEFIKPTSIQQAELRNIQTTKISQSGEDRGVPMKLSGPQKSSEELNSNSSRDARAFITNNKGKTTDELHIGANYNQIESLGSIAKITISGQDGVEPSVPSTVQNFRKSRDEENRKANPDIQDIITGIVKILHGKANGQGEGGRPRPPPSRINNRGPPRISDLPPLDFDAPPPYVPPTVQNNKIPPPYPFDLPPSPPPNIPLPPQPPNTSKLPAHPFIEGVPLPELLIPEKFRPSQSSEYDTISMSEPSLEMVPPLMAPHPAIAKPNNDTNKPEFIKNKGHSNKVSQNTSNSNKSGNKRVRPRPISRPKPPNSNATTTTKPQLSKRPPPVSMRPIIEIVADTTTEGATDPPVKKDTSVMAENVTASTVSKVEINATSAYETSETMIPTAISADFAFKPSNGSEILIVPGPMFGIGEAAPVLEPSNPIETIPITSSSSAKPTPSLSKSPSSTSKFEARPGIVLDDPEYKPGGHHKRPHAPHRPIITAPPAGGYGEIFDVTVHAIQGAEASNGKPVVVPVNFGGGSGLDVSVITKPEEGQDFVSIDGKRTYINLFGENTPGAVSPTAVQSPALSTNIPTATVKPSSAVTPVVSSGPIAAPPRRYKKPSQPPIRIDTCIVGDESTCDAAQNERCQTEDAVSSCHCRPGYNRRKHRDPCRRVISMSTSLRVDRLYDRKVTWRDIYRDSNSDDYQELSYEAGQAIDSAMSMTPFSDDFIASRVNTIYVAKNSENNEPAVFVNMTLQLEENLDTIRPAVRNDIQRHLIRVIQRRNNNVGTSALWVDSPPGSVLALEDIDECNSGDLHDCHPRAECTNTFGSYKCQCRTGTRDPWIGNVHREGRHCESCAPDYCSNRGECMFQNGHQVCQCTGSFYGTQCEIDGEVLGVAIGASVAAAIIIILTFICLCMWSRRWSREQKSAVGAGLGSPVFGFMANGPTVKTPNVGAPPYQISLEERMRWAQMAEVMAHANLYAQPEPGCDGRSYGGYPTLPSHSVNSLPLPAIAPPIPLPRLTLAAKGPHSTYGASMHGSIHHSTHGMRNSLDTSSSEEEDKADLLGRNFSAPRPKSRASITNQSGIYYDVDLERADMHKHTSAMGIPINTYTMSQHHRQFFR